MIRTLLKTSLNHTLTPLIRRLGQMNLLSINWQDVGDLEAASRLLNTMQASHVLQPREEQVPENQKVIVLAPHPDDEIIGCGGAVLQMINAGCSVHVIYFTSDASDIESEEINAVADKMGFTYACLGFPMRGLSVLRAEDLQELARQIRDFQPQAIFLPFVLDDHPDHRDVSFALIEIAESLKAYEETPVWTYQVYSALPLNAVVSIGDVMPRKLESLRLYQSRFKPRDWAHYISGLNAYNTRFLYHPGALDYAELYFKTYLKSYLTLCKSYHESLK
ncbi:MAG: PIG-L family deacetylase [Alphaproteobacteria bacterium]|nr:PIG-L family deacetylase [Alphaproteobacteria bacterium]